MNTMKYKQIDKRLWNHCAQIVNFVNFLVWSGTKVCTSCRSKKLQHEYLSLSSNNRYSRGRVLRSYTIIFSYLQEFEIEKKTFEHISNLLLASLRGTFESMLFCWRPPQCKRQGRCQRTCSSCRSSRWRRPETSLFVSPLSFALYASFSTAW